MLSRWTVEQRMLAAAMLCGFVSGSDNTSSFILFPAIRDSLADGDAARATWILTISGIVSAAILLQAGRLADRFGHDRIMIAAAAEYVAATVLAVVSPTLPVLVVARGLQALGVSSMVVSSIAVVVRDSPRDRLATALGRWGFWTATSGVIGPGLSALLLEVGSWRLPFAFGIPVGLAVLVLAGPSWNREHVVEHGSRVDLVGTAAAVGGLALLVLALLEGNRWGWTSGRIGVTFAVGALLLTLVVLRSRVHADPVVPLTLFASRGFVLSVLIATVSAAMFFGMWLALLSYATDVWGYSVLGAGLLLTLMPGTMTLFASPAGRMVDRRGFRPVMVAGSAVFTAGFAIVASLVGPADPIVLLLPAIVAGGIGMATVLPTNNAAGTRGLDAEYVGRGTAILQTGFRVGGALGSAAVAAFLAAGAVGDVSTHRDPIWLMAALGLVVTALCMGLSPARTAIPIGSADSSVA